MPCFISTAMENKLRITLVQTPLHWENPSANLQSLEPTIHALSGSTDLIALPEMFTSGFTMHPQSCAQTMDGPAITWMQRKASESGAAIVGSMALTENGSYYNRLVAALPDGTLHTYDKRHLFTLAGEHKHYRPGSTQLTFEWKGWRIFPAICYDMRFPVWLRNTSHYDLLIVVANWPSPRIYHWDQLLIARAIENQAFVAGVNRTGTDGEGHAYPGHSAIVDYSGKVLLKVIETDGAFTVELSKEDMLEYRSKFNFLADRDHFDLRL